jgi:hypothetical protein
MRYYDFQRPFDSVRFYGALELPVRRRAHNNHGCVCVAVAEARRERKCIQAHIQIIYARDLKCITSLLLGGERRRERSYRNRAELRLSDCQLLPFLTRRPQSTAHSTEGF